MQHPHPKACQQACYAMLSGKTLDEVIAVVGHSHQMAVEDRQRVVDQFGVKMDVWKSFPVSAFGIEDCSRLGALMRKNRTLLCSVFDYTDINFAHNVVIHDLQLYDPHDGMNPSWRWSRVIGYAQPVKLNE